MSNRSYGTPYSENFYVYRLTKNYRIYYFYLGNKTILNNTILCTLDNIDIPQKILGWESIILYPVNIIDTTNCNIKIDSDNGNVVYINENNKSFWGDFRAFWWKK